VTESATGVLVWAAGSLHDAIEADELTDDNSHRISSIRCAAQSFLRNGGPNSGIACFEDGMLDALAADAER
jgi:hypothetical protein